MARLAMACTVLVDTEDETVRAEVRAEVREESRRRALGSGQALHERLTLGHACHRLDVRRASALEAGDEVSR